ncbi:hypothetical protein Bbelb_172770 [Branchiostoma belcheri]|nr:hypothetical protein Bbelb_172770 [Branchiostoma belcheri]
MGCNNSGECRSPRADFMIMIWKSSNAGSSFDITVTSTLSGSYWRMNYTVHRRTFPARSVAGPLFCRAAGRLPQPLCPPLLTSADRGMRQQLECHDSLSLVFPEAQL